MMYVCHDWLGLIAYVNVSGGTNDNFGASLRALYAEW